MTLRSKFRYIQSICWIGVAADALWTIALLYPCLYGFLTGRPDFQPDLILRMNMCVGASLMAGWTLLLAWTAKEPIQRRGVLLLSVFPVITGLCVVTLVGYISGNPSNGWIIAKCAFLGLAMLSAYHIASTIAREDTRENNH